MEKILTNVFFFIVVLLVLVGLFYYTAKTKEAFFDIKASELLPANLMFVILDGKTSDDSGWNVYSNYVYFSRDTCQGVCSNTLVNSNNTCSVQTQSDGNLVIYNSDGAVWASNTGGQSPPYRSVMQDDGNYVLYDSNNVPLWSWWWGQSTQGGQPPYKLIIQPNCNLVVYDKNYRPMWQSNTWDKSAAPLSPPKPGSWTQIPGSLMSIAVTNDGSIFGTDSQFNIFYKTFKDSGFRTIQGNLRTIDTDGNYVCGIANDNSILCATMNDALNGNWTTIGNDAKSVSVSNGAIYAVNTDNSLIYSSDISNLNNIQWGAIPISRVRFHSISLDNGVIVGINNNNELMYADQNIFSANPNFTKINVLSEMNNFLNISIFNGAIAATDTDGNLWYSKNYKTTDWTKLKTNGKTFMANMASMPESPKQKVFGNNGTVSCNTYCGGVNGAPWNGELPVDWNGAKCIGTSPDINGCDTTFNFTPNSYCICGPTNNGWRYW